MLICQDVRNGSGCGNRNPDGNTLCSHCGRALRYALNLRDPGSTIGQYAIQDVIGYGGFGVVYKALDRARPGHEVALKETFDPDSIRSFQSEFQLLHHLRHDNLPTYEAMFEAEGNGFLVMEYVAGQNLA